MTTVMTNTNTPLLLALMDKRVKANVIDLDHYRIRGGMAVETDFIIRVEPTDENPKAGHPQFETFTISKTYSAFRTLGQQLKESADRVTTKDDPLPHSVHKLARYCETVIRIVETQRTQYLGKVNYNYVKMLAKKRNQIIEETLEATLCHFPDELKSHPFHSEVAKIIETFFLLDHCVGADDGSEQPAPRTIVDAFKTPKKYANVAQEELAGGRKLPFKVENPLDAVGSAIGSVGSFLKRNLPGDNDEKDRKHASAPPLAIDTTKGANVESLRSPVVPYTRKNRRSMASRLRDEDELCEVGEDANLLVDDDRPPTELVPNYSRPIPNFRSPGSKVGDLLENNPIMFALIAAASVSFLKFACKLTVTIDLDILLLLIWASFCVGLHTPRPLVSGVDKSSGPWPLPTRKQHDIDGRKLLRMSQSTPRNLGMDAVRDEDERDQFMEVNESPLPRFPDGAKLGSHLNCWSEPTHKSFHVRGPNYLTDKVKVASGPFVFPVRGADLFLTDTCPENAGSNSGIMGGQLREKPTFLINFRLPWGVFLAYFEIPERFLPFVRAGHEPGFDKSTLPSLSNMPPSDRCVARFLQGTKKQKNSTLKIVPVVVEGPWVVKSVVGGKPAIIGNKLPVNYFYQKAEQGKACYLEAALDIVSSSAARGILSVARTYTQVLTIDLGFVIQANENDELPEQMLIGTRIHGINPLTAPPYPPSKDMFMQPSLSEDADD